MKGRSVLVVTPHYSLLETILPPLFAVAILVGIVIVIISGARRDSRAEKEKKRVDETIAQLEKQFSE